MKETNGYFSMVIEVGIMSGLFKVVLVSINCVDARHLDLCVNRISGIYMYKGGGSGRKYKFTHFSPYYY